MPVLLGVAAVMLHKGFMITLCRWKHFRGVRLKIDFASAPVALLLLASAVFP